MIFAFLSIPNPFWGEGEFYKWLMLTHYWSGTTSPRIARDLYVISALGDDYLLGKPLITPLSNVVVNQQNYSNLAVWNISFSSNDNIWILNWVWKMTWVGAALKVTSRSSEDNCNVKLGFYLFQTHLGCRWLLQMTAVDTFWSDTISPRIAIMQFHSRGGGGGNYRLGIPFITPISQSWSESTHVLTCSTVVEINLESPK